MPRPKKVDVPAIIANLIMGEDDEKRRRSLFEFIGYLYHHYWPPLSAADASILELRYLVSLHEQLTKDVTASKVEISFDNLKLLSELVNSEDLDDLAATALLFPEYEQFIAEIVRFILAYKSKSYGKRRSASIKKAHFFYTVVGGFQHPKTKDAKTFGKRFRNWGTFSRRWSLLKPVFPFCYMDFYEFEGKLSRAHDHPELAKFVDDILDDRDSLRKFFEGSLYVYQTVRSTIDRRAFEGLIGLPNFPKWLRPRQVRAQPLTREQQTQMEEYTFG